MSKVVLKNPELLRATNLKISHFKLVICLVLKSYKGLMLFSFIYVMVNNKMTIFSREIVIDQKLLS